MLLDAHQSMFQQLADLVTDCTDAAFPSLLEHFNQTADMIIREFYGDMLDSDPAALFLLQAAENAESSQRAQQLRDAALERTVRFAAHPPAPIAPGVAEGMRLALRAEGHHPEDRKPREENVPRVMPPVDPEWLRAMEEREALLKRNCIGAENAAYEAKGLAGLSDAQFADCIRQMGQWGEGPYDWVEEQAALCVDPVRKRALLEICLGGLHGYASAATSGGEGLARSQEIAPKVRRLEALIRSIQNQDSL